MTKNLRTVFMTFLAELCWLGLPGYGFAQPAAEVTTGEFAIYHVGNSLTGDLTSQFRKIATPYENAQGNTFQWGLHFRGATSLSFMYANPTATKTSSIRAKNDEGYTWKVVGDDGFVPWTKALPDNHWDAVTLQPWQDDSKATLKSDTEAVSGMIAAARARPDNASTRFYLYCAWTDSKYDQLDSFRKAFLTPIPNQPDQLAKPTRDYFRHLADAVRQTHPEVAMIPAGEVLLALDEKMQAGKFEHFTSVQELHRDVIHLNALGANVAAWTAYAVIFKKSPVGLPANGLGTGAAQEPFEIVKEISPADLKLMQETVWDVVTSPELRDYTNVP